MFQIGQRVLFGRPNGEQTLGEVVKINPTKIKVRQVEARGRDRAVGTIWNVPPSLLRPAPDTATPTPPVTVVRPSRSAVNAELQALGLPGIVQGTALSIGRQQFTVVDCKVANHKYPVIATNANGTRYKFSVEQIRKALVA